jgi:hypothetical protein
VGPRCAFCWQRGGRGSARARARSLHRSVFRKFSRRRRNFAFFGFLFLAKYLARRRSGGGMGPLAYRRPFKLKFRIFALALNPESRVTVKSGGRARLRARRQIRNPRRNVEIQLRSFSDGSSAWEAI